MLMARCSWCRAQPCGARTWRRCWGRLHSCGSWTPASAVSPRSQSSLFGSKCLTWRLFCCTKTSWPSGKTWSARHPQRTWSGSRFTGTPSPASQSTRNGDYFFLWCFERDVISLLLYDYYCYCYCYYCYCYYCFIAIPSRRRICWAWPPPWWRWTCECWLMKSTWLGRGGDSIL